MKASHHRFKEADLIPWAGSRGLRCDAMDLVDRPLWWHLQGLQQTASGYGHKLTTRHSVTFEGKARRVYATCFSNAASHWFLFKGEKVFLAI